MPAGGPGRLAREEAPDGGDPALCVLEGGVELQVVVFGDDPGGEGVGQAPQDPRPGDGLLGGKTLGDGEVDEALVDQRDGDPEAADDLLDGDVGEVAFAGPLRRLAQLTGRGGPELPQGGQGDVQVLPDGRAEGLLADVRVGGQLPVDPRAGQVHQFSMAASQLVQDVVEHRAERVGRVERAGHVGHGEPPGGRAAPAAPVSGSTGPGSDGQSL